MERRDWNVSQRAVAYLICDGIVNADKYYPQEIAEWARDLMVGEGRVGIELIRGAIKERRVNRHATLVEQRDRLAEALRFLLVSHTDKDDLCDAVKQARDALATIEQSSPSTTGDEQGGGEL